ncbi:inhibitor of growth protein 5 isoform X1 [Exaiptasia diaphana]|uniref:Inhibitor of growth protein n=1 Tax=Exaiptasia diaphana TaxID=2652724 RepID=A0A913YG96_EXADI|nr:inhibitor of growth protein 5 isoform X1 [Exaiptasia diaphana]KXJ20758.1 Inhibitor of growth protein 5 [Exaiptasia diaphana]
MNHSTESRIGEIFSFSGIENLPFELQRNFTLMKDLDIRTQDLMKEIDSLSEDYVSSVRNMDSGERTDHLKKIEVAFSKSKEYVDDKVQLAMQTYEMVDKHIRKLDSDLARFECDLKEQKAKESGISEYEEEVTPPKRGRGRTSKKKDSEPKKKKKRDSSPVKTLGVTATLFSPEVVQVLDMPVDPNEPTYCICHQVSYGEMIGCDNIECPIEWFHFPCVGLTAKPKGKWYCPKCAQERKKK